MAIGSPAVHRLLAAVCVLAFAMPASAQVGDDEALSTAPAHIAYVDGDVTLAREGRAEPAVTSVPLVSGDRLRTGQGRAEVIFGDGSVLDVDQFTSIDFLSDELLRLLEGSVRLDVGGRDRVSYRIDTPSAAVRIETPGDYRVSLIGAAGAADAELITVSGEAALVNELGETYVQAGERAVASFSLAPSYAEEYNSARWDAFDSWVDERRNERLGTTSARYLPDDIHGYAGDFDRHGDWRYEYDYGYVWYPRVHVAWRPYFYGHWRWFGPWGWTWVSYDRWGWATHHYGRWGFRSGAWFWIPQRRWAPAWVYWASAPGYVGWCPLGWDNRPIFSVINVNVVNIRRGYDPYRAWTVVPRRSFGARHAVERSAVPADTLRRAVPRWTVQSASAPVRHAEGRRTAVPIYSAGRRVARPRSGESVTAVSPSRQAIPRNTAPANAPGSTARARQRTPDGVSQAPRTTLPASPGALGRGSGTTSRNPSRARSRDRDAGPGGSAPPAATMPEASRAPLRDSGTVRSRRRSDNDSRPTYVPRRPNASGAGAADRATPRSAPPSRSYRAPERSQPQTGERTGGSVSSPRGSQRRAQPRAQPVPRSAPPPAPRSGSSASPPRSSDRPSGRIGGSASRGSAPRVGGTSQRPSGGNERARSRQAPSGGAQRSGSSGGDSRRARPRPKPQ